MASSKNVDGVRFDTDEIGSRVWFSLLRDFRLTEGENFAVPAEQAMRSGVSKFREYSFPELGVIPIARFKRYHQLANLLKKYRFKSDHYTDRELEQRSYSLYLENQVRLLSPRRETASAYLIVQRARSICKAILGSFPKDQVFDHVRFGKKSSIGCPLDLAYIDEKLSNVRAFTSSSECAKWFFEDYLPGDPHLATIVARLLSGGELPDLALNALKAVLVPKTWKIHRMITPLTLLALFYSYGIGGIITDRLAEAGLDITKLQRVHQRLIQRFSRRKHTTFYGGSHATGDLSAASDSLVSELLNRILPRDWYRAIRKTFSHQIEIDGRMNYTASVLPMGNGLTFPVETLVFYSLLKAIGELTGT